MQLAAGIGAFMLLLVVLLSPGYISEKRYQQKNLVEKYEIMLVALG